MGPSARLAGVALEWFTVLKVPVLVVKVGGNKLAFDPAPEEASRWIELAGECLRILEYNRCEVKRHALTRLFDYLNQQELPVEAEVRSVGLALPGRRERARGIPVFFAITLEDEYWKREKEIKARGVLEVYSRRASVVRDPRCSAFACLERVVIDRRKYERVLGPFSTVLDPFIDEEALEEAKR